MTDKAKDVVLSTWITITGSSWDETNCATLFNEPLAWRVSETRVARGIAHVMKHNEGLLERLAE